MPDIFALPLYENLPGAFIALFVFIGAAFGSFFNVLSMRWPSVIYSKNDNEAHTWLTLRGMKISKPSESEIHYVSLMGGRSHCPHCKKPIPFYLNIPILSWVFLRGKSNCCGERISARYIAFELAGALIFGFVAASTGPTMFGLVVGIFLMVLVLIATLDYKEGFVPDALLFTAFILCALLSTGPHWNSLEQAILWYLIVFFGIMIPFYALGKLADRELTGMADFHLLGLSAAFLGAHMLKAAPLIIVLLIITAGIIKSLDLKRGLFVRLINDKAIPAGPAIISATLLTYFGLQVNSLI